MTDEADIVVCDDETDLREMVAEYLAKRGHRVRVAGNAVALRAAMAEAKPDLIVLDITMPGEDGLSVLRSLQQDDRPAVIMMTASGDTVDRVIGLEMGADDYLGKPVDLRELAARIKAVLRRREASRLAPSAGAKALPLRQGLARRRGGNADGR